MSRILFVSNGHGEEAIAARIADELLAIDPTIAIDHLALVGEFGHPSQMRDVGPRRTMPSGGLLAMGNVRNIMRDIGGGLIALTWAQRRFLREQRGQYDAVVAIGDTFALLMALTAKARTVFVGTAKSVYVAPYGPMEERVLLHARDVFVRDRATAERLREEGVPADAPGNVIVDLFAGPDDPLADVAFRDFAPALVLFPGSRQSAYDDASALMTAIGPLLRDRPPVGAVISLAPGLDAAQFAKRFTADGWRIAGIGHERIPFAIRDENGSDIARAWRGPIGPLLSRATLVIGQAGTANEAAAAAGIPVVALDLAGERKTEWYRRRQSGLLGDALQVVSAEPDEASTKIGALLDDPQRRSRMGHVGRERMGPPGGAHAIAQRIIALAGPLA